MKRILTVLALAMIVTPAFAQFGIGVVYDPTNYKNAILRYLQLQKQLQQLQQTYTVTMQQYEFMQSQARQVQNMVARYRALPSHWSNLSAANTLGNTSRWLNGINTGDLGTIEAGYGQVNRSLSDATAIDASDGLKRAYGLEQLLDGSSMNGMATIGRLRNNAQQLELHVKQLEEDSFSSSGDLNTQIAVLNKINAANVLLVRTMQDTNQLLTSLLEQQILTTQRNRTSSVGSINTQIYRQQHFADLMGFTRSVPTEIPTPSH